MVDEKCLPISDSIIKTSGIEHFFYYLNGEVNMGTRNYEKARESFEKYITLDDEYDVNINLQSIKLIPSANATVRPTGHLSPRRDKITTPLI